MNSEIIGIDLGTTNSCVAVLKNGVAEVIPNEYNEKTTPSVVSILSDGTRFVGKQAKDYQIKNLKNTIYESKRLLGRKFDDSCVIDRTVHWPFEVVSDNGNPKICVTVKTPTIAKKYYHPEEISAMILEKMKGVAQNYLKGPISKVVITVPAYFNNNQRQATIDAAKIANLDVFKIINEPIAAAFTYTLKNQTQGPCNILVFDLGGGTFDVSIINWRDKKFTVLSVGGDTDLGGADFDTLLYNDIVNEINKEVRPQEISNENQIRRIRAYCTKVKEELSSTSQTKFDLPEIVPGFDFEYNFSRAQFEKLTSPLIRKIMTVVKSTVIQAKMSTEDIDHIVLVGGSSKIPIIKQNLQEYFKKDLSYSVNPDEAVACGAVYQASILMGKEDVEVTDVTPFSLGLEAENIIMDVIIKKNTTLPAKQTKMYTTIIDNQTALRIIVYQGESKLTADNIKLGYFDLIGIPPAPARTPQINVTFDIDLNGILKVTATESSTKVTKEVEIITNTGRISQPEISRIKKENRESMTRLIYYDHIANEKNSLLKFCFQAKRTIESSRTIKSELKRDFLSDVELIIDWLENLTVRELEFIDLQHEKDRIQEKYLKLITE